MHHVLCHVVQKESSVVKSDRSEIKFLLIVWSRPFPLPDSPGAKREAEMSRMVTLVPPCNPFNAINKQEIVAA